jgi:oligosaccharide translocation protein RFT1
MSQATSSSYKAGSALGQLVYLVGLQLVSRAWTFILNILVVRKMGPKLYGPAAVHLYAVYTTILFMAREPLRMAAPRFSGNNAEIAASAVHVLITLPMGIALTLFTIWRLPQFIDSETLEIQGFVEAMKLTAVSAIMELVAEPISLVSQIRVEISKKVAVEATSIFSRGVFIYLFVNWANLGLTSFGYAYVLSSVCNIVAALWIQFQRSLKVESSSFQVGILDLLLPFKAYTNQSCAMLVSPLVWLTFGFWFQSLVKLVLTEGEKYVVMFFVTDDAGVFALVSNLGSMIVRLVFQPIEEIGAAEFKKLMGSEGENVEAEEIKRRRKDTSRILFDLIRFVMFIGLIAICFGPPFSFTVIHLLYGSEWSSTSAPMVLGFYCVYILLMALNGVSEGFVTSTLSASGLQRYNFLLFGFAIIYFSSIALFVHLNLSAGLVFVFSHCVNMLIRTLYNFYYIANKLEINMAILQSLPSTSVLISLVIATVISWMSEYSVIGDRESISFKKLMLHLVCGGAMGLVVLFVGYKDKRMHIWKLRAA